MFARRHSLTPPDDLRLRDPLQNMSLTDLCATKCDFYDGRNSTHMRGRCTVELCYNALGYRVYSGYKVPRCTVSCAAPPYWMVLDIPVMYVRYDVLNFTDTLSIVITRFYCIGSLLVRWWETALTLFRVQIWKGAWWISWKLFHSVEGPSCSDEIPFRAILALDDGTSPRNSIKLF